MSNSTTGLVLGIDTSTLTASVAIARGDAASAHVLTTGESRVNSHSQQLLGLIDDALKACSLELSAIDGIAIGAGPGSFTGLRIGMATAKGLAFSIGKPLWAVSSLAALAVHAETLCQAIDDPAMTIGPDTLVVPVLDARRSEIFAGFYRVHENRVTEIATELVLAPETLGPAIESALAQAGCDRAIALGDGFSVYPDRLAQALAGPLGDRVRVLPMDGGTPPAAAVARLALSSEHEDIVISGAPSYVRLSEAEIKYPNGNPGGAFKPRKSAPPAPRT